jgi:hypothetical protein
MGINILDGSGGYDGKVTPRYLQRVVNRIVRYIDGLVGTPADSRPYKVYTALISQEGTSAPTATVLENTVGAVTFSYTDVGVYNVVSPELFTDGKTFVETKYTLIDTNDVIGYASIAFVENSNVVITSRNSSSVLANDRIANHPIEIRVYE